MKRAKGTGTVFKLKGNRHKPYVAYVKTGRVFNVEKQTSYQTKKAIGYYATQKEAQTALELYLQNPYDLTMANITFREIWDKIQPNLSDLSASRLQCYESAFNKYMQPVADMPIRDIRTNHLQAVIDSCSCSSSVKTNIKAVMNKVYRYAMQNDIITKDYSEYITYKRDEAKVQRTLFNKDEIDKLWLRSSDWQYAFILILLYTGMRPKELIDLRTEDVYADYLDVKASKTNAGIRKIPIHPAIANLVSELRASNTDYLIQTEKGCKITYQNFMRRDLPKIQEYIDYPHQPYECRHSFITRANDCKLDSLCVQKMVGHKPPTITEQVYTHISLDTLKNEINKLYY